jgi:hypothetical protein
MPSDIKHKTFRDFRSPLARLRDQWLFSPEGMKCGEGTTSGVYLQNRLQRAFEAGWNALERRLQESKKKVTP